MVAQKIEQENELFKSRQLKNIALVTFKTVSMEWLSSLEKKEKLLSYFDMLSDNSSIKSVILRSPNNSLDKKGFFEQFEAWSNAKIYNDTILRIFRAFDQIILRIVGSDKLFVSAQSGKVIFPFFGLSLACDHRIVADNFMVQNPESMVGLAPKGAAAFFLTRAIGSSKSMELLLAKKDIGAYELLRLKLVDSVAPFNKLRHTALETAKNLCSHSLTTLAGVKRLVNYSMRELANYLEYEDDEIFRTLSKLKQNKRA